MLQNNFYSEVSGLALSVPKIPLRIFYVNENYPVNFRNKLS